MNETISIAQLVQFLAVFEEQYEDILSDTERYVVKAMLFLIKNKTGISPNALLSTDDC